MSKLNRSGRLKKQHIVRGLGSKVLDSLLQGQRVDKCVRDRGVDRIDWTE